MPYICLHAHTFPRDCAADCYAFVWTGRRKKNRLFCFTNHLIHCRTFLFSCFCFCFLFCTPADVPKCCSLCALSQRGTLSVLYLKTLSLLRKITWVVKLPGESNVCDPVSKPRKKPTDPLGINEPCLNFVQTRVWRFYKSIICALTCII